MSSQLFSVPAKQELRPQRTTNNSRASLGERAPAVRLNAEQSAKTSRLLQQLFQSITVLGHTTDLALTGGLASPLDKALCATLPAHARQAEESMRALRDLRLTSSSVLTELSQSLTVLVLAADMIANGQLAGGDALAFYDLLRRNSNTTIRCLNQLYVVFGLESTSAE